MSSKQAPPTSKPPIRSSQYDSSTMGSLASAVNLFRGDLDLPLTLFTLPGRSKESGLDLSVTLSYDSSVHREAGTWNREAPTGVLGLGWSLPASWIEVVDEDTPAPEARRYVLHDNGSATELVQQPQSPLLLTMDAELAGELHDGSAVPPAILAEFRSHGLALAASATVTRSEDGWLVDDDDLQQQFVLCLGPTALEARAGGRAYQRESHDFSRITYYQRYERWLIVDSSGRRKSFGGRAPSAPRGFAVGVNNSIAWSVWWAGEAGEALWTGPSTITDGQIQVARAWYLASMSDRFGDSLQLVYNGWPRTPEGLIPGAEQRVGAEGLPYTKAVYLTGLVDVFGRIVELRYADKLWSDLEPETPREYADPHRDQPSDEPNAYQDRYETKYLAAIEVRDGDVMLSYDFVYEPRPGTPWPAVASLAGLEGNLAGDSCKRLLTGIVMTDADRRRQPGMVFEYYFDDAEDGAQRGAMAAITYPQGGRARLSYAHESLDICDRRVSVPCPHSMPIGSIPRVFYGPDYVVSTWYHEQDQLLSLQVYTWVGRWVAWQLDPNDACIDCNGINNLDSLDVLANEALFGLSFKARTGGTGGTGGTKLYLFQRAAGWPTQWQLITLPGGTPAGRNEPTRTYPTGDTVQLQAGNAFLTALQTNANATRKDHRCQHELLWWNWSTRTWTRESSSLSDFKWIAAHGEYFVMLDNDGTVTLNRLDGAQRWQQSTTQIDELSVEDPGDVQLAAGAAMLAINRFGSVEDRVQSYYTTVLRWDASYRFQPPQTKSFQDQLGASDPVSWTPQVIDDTLVATNGNLLRFNGREWIESSELCEPPPSHATARFAYGPDFAVRIWASTTDDATAKVLAFDANTDSTAWTRPVAPSTKLSKSTESWANWPQAGNDDYAVLGPNLYARGTATSWADVFAADPLVVLSDVGPSFVSQSLLNEGPDFVAYAVGTDEQAVQVLVFENGAVGDPQSFSSERLFTASLENDTDPGTAAQGPQCFVSYDAGANRFDEAQTIDLHRYAGDAIDGPIEAYPIGKLELFDGFETDGRPRTSICYAYDTTTAACDPSGETVQYHEVKVVPGSDEPGNTPYGYRKVDFLNGLGSGSSAGASELLYGMQVRTRTYDSAGQLLDKQTSEWAVVRDVASDPCDGSAEPIALYGGWVCQASQTTRQDQVASTTSYGYVPEGLPGPFTGQVVTATTMTTDTRGMTETIVQRSRHGVEVDASLRALNALEVGAGSYTSVQVTDGDPAPVRATAVCFASWPSRAGEGVLTPGREALFELCDGSSGEFPYADYCPGDLPKGWVLRDRVIARSPYGQLLEHMDACGVHGSHHYDKDYAFMVAKASNAGVEEIAYLGFEDYEDWSTWMTSGVSTEANDALTGTRAARLAGSGALLSTTITPARRRQRYVLSCWYKTSPGFTASEASGCRLTVLAEGTRGEPSFASFEPSDGAWQQLCLGLELDPGPGELRLELLLEHRGDADLLVDSVFLVPLVGGLLAKSYDTRLHQVLSLQDSGGRIRRNYYDRSARPVLQLGLDGSPVELDLVFSSRQGNADDRFDPASPNAALTLHPAGRSYVESFRDGGDWQRRWAPDDSAQWQAEAGELYFTGASTDALRWVGPAPSRDGWALYFEVSPATEAPVLGVEIAGVRVTWSDGAYSSDGLGDPLFTPPSMAQHWLLVCHGQRITMFGDGQLLFSAAARLDDPSVAIVAASALGLRHVALLGEPRVGLDHQDGAGRQRQLQQLHGDDCIVGQIVYDALSRQLAVTRCAPGRFGCGAELPPLQYRPSFIDQSAFLANLDDSGVMPGDLADYYAGQIVGGIARSDDEGYAYTGTRWEASPRHQPLEYGQPGLDYAITNVATTTADTRATTQIIVGPNDGGAIPLTAGCFIQNQVVSPVKTRALQVLDNRGRSVAYAALDEQGTVIGRTSVARHYGHGCEGTELGTEVLVQPPNALVDGPQGAAAGGYLESCTLDALGRTCRITDPDAGTTELVYDGCGRLRFVQPQLDPGELGFIYYRYDRIGRMIEEGRLDQAWDRASLEARASDFDWPRLEDGACVAVRWIFDGDGSDASAIGRAIAVETRNAAPSFIEGGRELVARERYAYDRRGRVVLATLELEGARAPSTPTSGSLRYDYNNLGELLSLGLPEGAPISGLCYHYDALGRIQAITTSGDQSRPLASYRHTPDGALERERLGGGAWERTMEYASPGWLRRVVARSTDGKQYLELAYEHYADGRIAERRIGTVLGAESPEEVSDAYTYDAQGRLTSATGSSGIDGYAYDPNGNLWSIDHDTKDRDCFPLEAGSNRLARSQLADAELAVEHDAQGRVRAALGGELAYQGATGLSAGWAFGETRTQLGYGGHRQRVYKRVEDGSGATVHETVYFCGPSLGPIVRVDDGEWTIHVQGPTGLLALIHRDAIHFPLEDTTGSVWALVDADGTLVGRYDYLPFGTCRELGGSAPAALAYRFQGREWDAEAELYDFGDRMYSPKLRRFLSPDPAREFASPYVFVGNDPLQVTDASGDMSLWGQIGIGLATGATILAGVAISAATLGTASPAAAAADSAVVGAEVGIEATADAVAVAATSSVGATTDATAAASLGGADSISEVGSLASSATSMEVSSGAAVSDVGSSSGEELATETSSSWSTKLASSARGVVGSSLTSGGTSGLKYDVQHGQGFSAQSFFESVGLGMLSGAVSASFGAAGSVVAGQIETSFGKAAGVAARAISSGVKSMAGSDVTKIITNCIQRKPWYSGLAEQSVDSFKSAATYSALSGGARALVDNPQASPLSRSIRKLATSTTALRLYVSGASYLGNRFTAWSKAHSWGHG